MVSLTEMIVLASFFYFSQFFLFRLLVDAVDSSGLYMAPFLRYFSF